MTTNNDEMRQFVRELFGRATDTEPPTAGENTPEPPTAPTIPGQAAQPAPQPRWTEEQRWVNQLFNAGTIREIN